MNGLWNISGSVSPVGCCVSAAKTGPLHAAFSGNCRDQHMKHISCMKEESQRNKRPLKAAMLKKKIHATFSTGVFTRFLVASRGSVVPVRPAVAQPNHRQVDLCMYIHIGLDPAFVMAVTAQLPSTILQLNRYKDAIRSAARRRRRRGGGRGGEREE